MLTYYSVARPHPPRVTLWVQAVPLKLLVVGELAMTLPQLVEDGRLVVAAVVGRAPALSHTQYDYPDTTTSSMTMTSTTADSRRRRLRSV